MKNIFLILLFPTVVTHAGAQTFNLSFGSDNTLDIMTWNLEWFPKNGATTMQYVTEIIDALDPDIIALQEISNFPDFVQMASELPGWEQYYVNDNYSGLAYLYKTDVIQVNNLYEIYESANREFPRAPSVMKFTAMGVDYTLINNHFKCCGNGSLNSGDSWDEETRRRDASVLLKTYIDENLANEKVLVVGDLNDILTDSPANNVFQGFLDDNSHYQFLDMNIAEGNNDFWSYPTWPSHLDHLLMTDEVFGDIIDPINDVMTLAIDEQLNGGWFEYDTNVSDHRPVGIRLNPVSLSVNDEFSELQSGMIISPNPSSDRVRITLFASSEERKIKVFDPLGQLVFSTVISPFTRELFWKTKDLQGLFTVVLTGKNNLLARRKLLVI